MHLSRIVRLSALALFVIFLIAEIGLRYFRVLDFPLYENSPELGYIPLANQHGSFLGMNEWAFNELGMGVADHFRPGNYSRNILLIGDSIVLGGNHVDQDTKLGPVMNASCPRIWPVSAASWAFLNELRYIRTHDYLLPTFDRIVFVSNSEDFGEASTWSSEYTHPT